MARTTTYGETDKTPNAYTGREREEWRLVGDWVIGEEPDPTAGQDPRWLRFAGRDVGSTSYGHGGSL